MLNIYYFYADDGGNITQRSPPPPPSLSLSLSLPLSKYPSTRFSFRHDPINTELHLTVITLNLFSSSRWNSDRFAWLIRDAQ